VVELTAYAKAGRAQDALTRLKAGWLPMIQQGYRRFFEDIEPSKDPIAQLAMYGRKYGASLCHAWAGAVPVMTLSRGVLGIEPIEPGYRVCTVVPQRCSLNWVRGAVPTTRGLIEIEWHGRKAN
jgi:alpha-L-rhamnosidase